MSQSFRAARCLLAITCACITSCIPSADPEAADSGPDVVEEIGAPADMPPPAAEDMKEMGPRVDVDADATPDLSVAADMREMGLPDGPWRSQLYPDDWTPEHTGPDQTFLHDFSYAGYHNSERELGSMGPEQIFDVTDYGADATGTMDTAAAIQNAIDAAGAAPMGGVVLLPAGRYRIDGALTVTHSYVVLRGEGAGRTRLHFTATQGRSYKSHLTFGGPVTHNDERMLAADGRVRADYVMVEDAQGLEVGQDVAVGWVITPEFVREHGMEEYWQAFNGRWRPFFRREIVAIDTSTQPHTITLDVPLRYDALTRDGASVRVETNLIEEVGVEQLSIGDATTWELAWSEDQIHVVEFRGVKDAWVRDVSSFVPPTSPTEGKGAGAHVQSGGILVRDSKRVTIADTTMGRAQNRGPGGNGYLFNVRSSSEILWRDCVGTGGRHNFIASWDFGLTGSVWLRIHSREGVLRRGPTGSWEQRGPSEFHHSLAMANLIDSSVLDDGWEAHNRKEYSSGAGHTATASVFWNVSGAGPLTSYQYGYGYIIGTGSDLEVDTQIRDFDLGKFTGWNGTEPRDWAEGIGRGPDLMPRSLFEDQLRRRLERQP